MLGKHKSTTPDHAAVGRVVSLLAGRMIDENHDAVQDHRYLQPMSEHDVDAIAAEVERRLEQAGAKNR